MSNVIPFRDPDAPLEGEARDRALDLYQGGMKKVAGFFVGAAFSASARIPGCVGLGCEDALPAFVDAMRAEVDKLDYCRRR